MAFGNLPYVLANYSYDSRYLKEQSERILDLDLGASTDLTEALMMAAANSFAGRESVRKVIIVVSDGAPNDEKTAYLTAMEIKVSPDIDLCGVYIRTEAGKPEYLRKLVSLYCYEVTTYDKLYDVLKEINLCF